MGNVKKKPWGGRRAGAGKPVQNPEGPVEVVGVGIPGQLLADLDAIARAEGWSRSQAVTEAVRRLVKAVRGKRK